MSWKKILFLCLGFIFVFSGVFGFYEKANAQYAGMLIPQNDPSMKSIVIGNSGGLTAKTNWGSDASTFNRKDNVKTNLWYDSSKYVVTEYSVGTYKNGSYGSDKRIVALQNIGGNDTKDKFEAFFSIDSNGKATKIDSYQNSQGDVIKQPTTKADLNGILTMEQKKSLESAGKNPYSPEVQNAKDQFAKQNNETQKNGDQQATVKPQEGNSCGSSISDALNPLCWAAYFIQNVILRISALIAGLSGLLFDKILGLTVLNMATNININSADSFINIGWKVLRDVVNIMFIFVLLFTGIMTIVKGFESGTSKKIATVIVVALLINFSLFFTKIIIDASNIVAINFYNAIENASSSKGNSWQGIAAVFIEKAGMANIWELKLARGNSKLEIILQGLGGSALLIVLGIVIFIGSIMFVTRYLILIVVLLASSAAIGSWILPSLKKSIYDKWWSALIGQSFFAPIFFLFLYITLIFIDKTVALNPSKEGGWYTIFTSTTNPENSINLVINYILIVGALIGTIIISKSLSDMAGKGAGKITGLMGGTALGLAAWGGRNSLGRLGQVMNSEKMQERARNGSKLALLASATGSRMKKGSYDMRTAKGVGALLGTGGIGAKDGMEVAKGGIGAQDKKWLEFKESVRGTYSTSELNAKAADAIRKDKGGEIATAKRAYDMEKDKMKALEEEEKNQKIALGKSSDKTEQDRIQKRLEQIQKEKEAQEENIKRAEEAQKKAEKTVRDKELAKYKASKSNKDKAIEAMKKLAEEDEKKSEKSDESKKPDKPKS